MYSEAEPELSLRSMSIDEERETSVSESRGEVTMWINSILLPLFVEIALTFYKALLRLNQSSRSEKRISKALVVRFEFC